MPSSPLNLVLLLFFLQLALRTDSRPALYDLRQESSSSNGYAKVSDVEIVLLPPKSVVKGFEAILPEVMALFTSPFASKKASNTMTSYHNLRPAELSPYAVDLDKSQVPLEKVDSPKINPKNIDMKVNKDNLAIDKIKESLVPTEKTTTINLNEITKVIENKIIALETSTVIDFPTEDKKKAPILEKATASAEINEVEVSTKRDTTSKPFKEQTKNKFTVLETSTVTLKETSTIKAAEMESKEVLTLIQEGIEECGPDGHRNEEGTCVYTPIHLR